MIALYLGLFGLVIFVGGALILGTRLRREPSKENAEKLSRVMHFLFFSCLGAPFAVAFFYPGLGQLDGLIRIPPLPLRVPLLILGIILLLPGLYWMGLSLQLLRTRGHGANAFRLTHNVVDQDIYQRTRNPMSLGYYLVGLGIAFISGSTLLTLYVLLGLIPAHLFFLLFFEERELELRFGESYRAYKQKVPFLFPVR